jgi:hypothetical protein
MPIQSLQPTPSTQGLQICGPDQRNAFFEVHSEVETLDFESDGLGVRQLERRTRQPWGGTNRHEGPMNFQC